MECQYNMLVLVHSVFFSSRRRHTVCALVTGVQTCALPIWKLATFSPGVPVQMELEVTRALLGGHFIGYQENTEHILLVAARTFDLAIGRASCRDRVCQTV